MPAADKGAFFGSILGTLNHIVAGDTIWLRRFMHHPSDFASLKAMSGIPVPAGLAHVHSEHLDSLLELRLRLDAIIEALAAELSDGDLAQALSYRNSRGDFRKRFVDIGVTDLLEWIPDL